MKGEFFAKEIIIIVHARLFGTSEKVNANFSYNRSRITHTKFDFSNSNSRILFFISMTPHNVPRIKGGS